MSLASKARRLTTAKGRRAAAARLRGHLRGLRGVSVHPEVKLTGSGRYDLARGCTIRRGAKIYVGEGATFTVGAGSYVGIRNVINVASSVAIGESCALSWDVQILDTDFHEVLAEDGSPRPSVAPVVIGDRVLVGTGSIILKGVTIGDGAVVGAGSVVTKDVHPGTVVAGNPAREVGRTAGWR